MLTILVPALIVTGGAFAYLSYSGLASPALIGNGTNSATNTKIDVTYAIHHQEQNTADFIWLAQMALRGQFWSPSCLFFCNSGVTYTMDPTITNEGHDFEQCKVFGTSTSDTCTSADVATIVGVSTSNTAIAATDTYSTGPCSSGNVASSTITSNGFTATAGTITAGTAGTTVTTTIAHQFTASGTVSSLQTACLLTETTGSPSNELVYAEGSFGPDSLVSGNTLTITWTISRT